MREEHRFDADAVVRAEDLMAGAVHRSERRGDSLVNDSTARLDVFVKAYEFPVSGVDGGLYRLTLEDLIDPPRGIGGKGVLGAVYVTLLIEEFARRLTEASHRNLLRALQAPGVLVQVCSRDTAGDPRVPERQIVMWRRCVVVAVAVLEAVKMKIEQGLERRDRLLTSYWRLYLLLLWPVGAQSVEVRDEKALPRTIEERLLSLKSWTEVFGIEVTSNSGLTAAGESYAGYLDESFRFMVDAVLSYQEYEALRRTEPKSLELIASCLVMDADSVWQAVPKTKDGRMRFTRASRVSREQGGRVSESALVLLESFFLPRFELRTPVLAALSHRRGDTRGLTGLVFALPLLTVSLVCGLIAFAGFVWAPTEGIELPLEPNDSVSAGASRWWALASFASVGCAAIAAMIVPKPVQLVLMLRIPASAFIGVAVLVTISAQWWSKAISATSGLNWASGSMVVLCFLGVAFWYLYSEVSGHEVRPGKTAVRRSLIVLLISLAETVVLLLAAFPTVFSVFAELPGQDASQCPGPAFIDCVMGGDPPRRFFLILVPSAFVVVLGLFSQILWDEKAITAPLAHTSWRRSA